VIPSRSQAICLRHQRRAYGHAQIGAEAQDGEDREAAGVSHFGSAPNHKEVRAQALISSSLEELGRPSGRPFSFGG
jgi:hypothetical protein